MRQRKQGTVPSPCCWHWRRWFPGMARTRRKSAAAAVGRRGRGWRWPAVGGWARWACSPAGSWWGPRPTCFCCRPAPGYRCRCSGCRNSSTSPPAAIVCCPACLIGSSCFRRIVWKTAVVRVASLSAAEPDLQGDIINHFDQQNVIF